MRGHIRQKGKSSWQIQVYAGVGADGKYRRHFETIHGRKSDAQKRLNAFLVSLEKGVYTPPGRLTVAEHLHITGLKATLRLTAHSARLTATSPL